MPLSYNYDKHDRRDILRHAKALEGFAVGDVYELELHGKQRNKILEDYESKLQLVEKFLDTKQRVSRIHELATELKAMTDRPLLPFRSRKEPNQSPRAVAMPFLY